jgi:hypothetical protein
MNYKATENKYIDKEDANDTSTKYKTIKVKSYNNRSEISIINF